MTIFDSARLRRWDMAEGVMRLSEKYGGEEFAIHSKGLELAAYEPRGAVVTLKFAEVWFGPDNGGFGRASRLARDDLRRA